MIQANILVEAVVVGFQHLKKRVSLKKHMKKAATGLIFKNIAIATMNGLRAEIYLRPLN